MRLILTIGLMAVVRVACAQHCERGDTFFEEFRYNRAMASYALCYANDPDNMQYLLKMGQCNYQLGRLSEARRYYALALAQDAASVVALNHLGLIYSKQSNIGLATAQYERLVGLDSLNSYYYKQLARLAMQQGDVSRSVYNYRMAHAINGLDVDVIAELSGIYQKLRRYDDAQELVSAGLATDSTDVRLWLEGANIAYRQRRYGQVLHHIDRMLTLRQDTSAKAMQLLGVSLYHLKRSDEAIAVLGRAAELLPDSEFVYYYLGLAYRDKGEHALSTEHLERAIDHAISDNISAYYTDLAGVLEKRQLFAESIRAYKAAYESSKNKTLLYQLARNYDLYYKDKTTALMYYQKYLAMNDTGNRDLMNYSAHRVDELREVMHFE